MKKSTTEKIAEMQNALLTIKRLMPEVEAELSSMSGVGAALRKNPVDDLHQRIKKQFAKTTKVK